MKPSKSNRIALHMEALEFLKGITSTRNNTKEDHSSTLNSVPNPFDNINGQPASEPTTTDQNDHLVNNDNTQALSLTDMHQYLAHPSLKFGIVTSLPDICEMETGDSKVLTVREYKEWFINATMIIFDALTIDPLENTDVSSSAFALFYQTDSEVPVENLNLSAADDQDGHLQKVEYLLEAMHRFNDKNKDNLVEQSPMIHLVWHKYASTGTKNVMYDNNTTVNITDVSELIENISELNCIVDNAVELLENASHLVCFQKRIGMYNGESLDKTNILSNPNVLIIPRGPKPKQIKLRQRCMGVNAAIQMCLFVKSQYRNLFSDENERGSSDVIILDPFCGAGTVLAAANFCNMRTIGVDLSKRRIRQSNHLEVSRFSFRDIDMAKLTEVLLKDTVFI